MGVSGETQPPDGGPQHPFICGGSGRVGPAPGQPPDTHPTGEAHARWWTAGVTAAPGVCPSPSPKLRPWEALLVGFSGRKDGRPAHTDSQTHTHTHRHTHTDTHSHTDSHTQTHTDTHTHSYTHSFRVPGLTHGRMDDSEAMDERVGGRCGWGEPGAGGAPLLQGPGAARGPADGSRALFSTDLQPLPFRPAPLRLRRPLGLVTAF